MEINKTCQNCDEKEIQADGGIVTFYGDLCECCHEKEEMARIEDQDTRDSLDFDYSMN